MNARLVKLFDPGGVICASKGLAGGVNVNCSISATKVRGTRSDFT
jgi:hypothetical protein